MSHEKAPNSSALEAQQERPEHDSESLEGVQDAASSAEVVFVEAFRQNGSAITYTEGGVKGFAETSIPGGHITGEFNSVDSDPEMSAIHIDYNNQNIDIDLSGGYDNAKVYINGTEADANSLPAVQSFIHDIKSAFASGQEVEGEAEDKTTSEEDQEPRLDVDPEAEVASQSEDLSGEVSDDSSKDEELDSLRREIDNLGSDSSNEIPTDEMLQLDPDLMNNPTLDVEKVRANLKKAA